MDRAVGRNRPQLNVWLALACAFSTAFLALFFLWPTGSLIFRALSGADETFGSRLTELLGNPRFVSVLLFSFGQAGASALLTLVAAWPLTWAISNRRFWARNAIRSAVTVAFVLPTVVVAAAVMSLTVELFGADALSKRAGPAGLFAILCAHVFFNIAVVLRTVGSHWQKLDRNVEEAAATLGASRFRIFWTISWPRLRAAIISALAIVFFFSFTSFAVILLLGGPTRTNLETEIYRYALIRAEIDTAAVLALIQILAVTLFVVVDVFVLRRAQQADSLVADRAITSTSKTDRFITALYVWGSMLALGAVPYSLVAQSLRPTSINRYARSGGAGGSGAGVDGGVGGGVGGAGEAGGFADFFGINFDGYSALGTRNAIAAVSGVEAIDNSLRFAVVATIIAAVIGTLAALVIVHSKALLSALISLLWTLPIGVSALTLGFGILISFARQPVNWRSTWAMVPIVHSLMGSVFVIRSLVPLMRSIPDVQRSAAKLLGASKLKILLSIDLAQSRGALIAGVGFAFAVSLGEFGATTFLSRDAQLQTVPLLIARLLATPGVILRRQAMALSVVLMAATALTVLLTDRLDKHNH